MPFRRHLISASDLVTSYEAIRAGFVSLALEKNRRATPFLQQARILRKEAQTVDDPRRLIELNGIRASLLVAAGVSDKALNHLTEADKSLSIENLIETFLRPAGKSFVEELVYRFLLTKGDALGGSMRNYGGTIAMQRFSTFLLARMRSRGESFHWRRDDKSWAPPPQDDAAAALMMKGLHWFRKKSPRTLLYNVNVPTIGKNIDLCLCRATPENSLSTIPTADFVALGELKGGIDPAGADEHWKTARSALNRIHEGFAGSKPEVKTFFVGAAIVTSMSQEIWHMLQSGSLTNAANLTNDDQLISLVDWIASL